MEDVSDDNEDIPEKTNNTIYHQKMNNMHTPEKPPPIYVQNVKIFATLSVLLTVFRILNIILKF